MDDAIDLGADGLAAQARAWVERPIARPGASYEREARVWVKAYRDECTLDALNSRTDQWRIPDRPWRAGMLFRGWWIASREAYPVVAGYGERVAGAGVAAMVAYRSDARARLDAAEKALRAPQWMAVCAVAGEDERTKGRWQELRDGLDVLADLWDVSWEYRRWRYVRR